ncbi:hypothetical protein [Streptomyces chiangmaiensis]
MTATIQAVIPVLRDVRDTEAALAGGLREHLVDTPPGERRESLEQHIDDAHDHIHALDQRLAELHAHQSVLATLDSLAGRAVDTSRRSLQTTIRVAWAMASAPANALLGHRDKSHQFLKNLQNEYALASAAMATARTGERIAQRADDVYDAELLGTIRADSEAFLDTLDRGLEDAAGAPAAERPVAADELPISDYEQLTDDQIAARLPGLSPAQLSQVEAFERANAGRAAVLDQIAALSHPWPDYDDMNVNEIRARLRKDADPALAIRVMDYERRHQARSTVITAAMRLSTV